MKKFKLLAIGLLVNLVANAAIYRVVTEVAGVDLDGDVVCCYYLDHMIYMNLGGEEIYMGCYSSMAGDCCPSTGTLHNNGNGNLTDAQKEEVMQSEEFTNENKRAILEYNLQQGGGMGSIDTEINRENGRLVLIIDSNLEGVAYLTIRPFTFGHYFEQPNVTIQKGINKLEVNYSPFVESNRPQNYIIKLIGKDVGFKTIAKI